MRTASGVFASNCMQYSNSRNFWKGYYSCLTITQSDLNVESMLQKFSHELVGQNVWWRARMQNKNV